MANVSNHYVSREQLRTASTQIEAIIHDLLTYERKISENLTNIKDTITINHKKIDNKSYDIEKNMVLYHDNCRGSSESFIKVAERYETASSGSGKIFDQL